MDARGRMFVLLALFASYNLTSASQTVSQVQKNPTDNKVVLSTTVTNKKEKLVGGLQRGNFHISIDKRRTNIVDFREEDLPLSLGIILDASASVVPDRSSARSLINLRAQALRRLLEISNPANEYFLMVFNDQPRLLLDWTADSKAIIDTVDVVKPKGNSAFYDACFLAINKVLRGRYSKRVLILISDGQDNASTYSLAQIRDQLKSSDVLVYSVNFAFQGIAGSELGPQGQNVLNDLSLVSGGKSFMTSQKGNESVSVFELIATELRHQYTIAVTTDDGSDDRKWHKIKIKVEAAGNASAEMKHLSARTREGFYLRHRLK